MTWPLDAEGIRHFAEGLEEILVVEEKRQVIEYQLKEQLYNWREDAPPRDRQVRRGRRMGAARRRVAAARRRRADAGDHRPGDRAPDRPVPHQRAHPGKLDFLDAKEKALASPAPVWGVLHYCSGCPHNSSTKVPEGSRALAGIGCHYMALWLSPDTTQTFSQMGGEGVPWIGQAPFTKTRHVFANLGDGTYSHSGLLAIRQAVAAQVSITYKILFNTPSR